VEHETKQYVVELDAASCITPGRRFFENITLKLEPGKILCVVGASGGGKSALCGVAAGLSLPTSGAARLLGRDTASCIYADTQKLRMRIGYVFQRSALIANMTIAENVALPLLYHTSLAREEIEKKIAGLLDVLEIRDIADARPAGLPEVTVQRANLARALALDPEVLFFDEPIEDTGFGRHIKKILKPFLKNLAKEKNVGIFMVSRDPHFAYRTADRIGFMEDGVLVEEGTVEEIKIPEKTSRIGLLRAQSDRQGKGSAPDGENPPDEKTEEDNNKN